MNRKRSMHLFAGRTVLLFFAILIGSPSLAMAKTAALPLTKPESTVNRRADLIKILSVLDTKLEGHKASEKVREKLSTLNDKHITLLASLSERIADNDHTVGADIAFLLMTALIVFP